MKSHMTAKNPLYLLKAYFFHLQKVAQGSSMPLCRWVVAPFGGARVERLGDLSLPDANGDYRRY